MANRWMQQFFYSLNHSPVYLQGSANIGASGATSALKGSGIKALTRLAAGVYKLDLQDNYYYFLGADAKFKAPVTGASVAGGAFVTGTAYQIVTLGTTTQAQWQAAGVPAGVEAKTGVGFVATGAGAGTGTVQALGDSGIVGIEFIGDQSLTMNPLGALGASILFKCVDADGAAADPAAGSVMIFEVFVRNSSVKGKGE